MIEWKKARDERREKRLESRAQVREKWIERDIEIIRDSVDKTLTALRDLNRIAEQQQKMYGFVKAGKLSKGEAEKRDEQFAQRISENTQMVVNTLAVSASRVYSFDDEIAFAYREYDDLVGRLQNYLLGNSKEDYQQIIQMLFEKSGVLQKKLRDKVFSIRDIE